MSHSGLKRKTCGGDAYGCSGDYEDEGNVQCHITKRQKRSEDNILEDNIRDDLCEDEETDSGHVCSLCKINIFDHERVTMLFKCGHFFHEQCADPETVIRCPTCDTWLDGRFGKYIEVMRFRLIQEFLLKTPRQRTMLAFDWHEEGEIVDKMTTRCFYETLNEKVFRECLPVIRNVYFKTGVIHHKRYNLN
jgi:hypothetical protein